MPRSCHFSLRSHSGTVRGLIPWTPAYLGDPYLHEDTGYNPELRHLWEGFDTLDPRSGTSEEYGREQWEGIIARFGEAIHEWVSK